MNEQNEKQAIEEMSYSVCRLENKPENCASCMWKANCDNYLSAENYYAAGYRKQSEGEWKQRYEKAPRYVCTNCNHLCNNKGYKFCPNCGAKMKGGAE